MPLHSRTSNITGTHTVYVHCAIVYASMRTCIHVDIYPRLLCETNYKAISYRSLYSSFFSIFILFLLFTFCFAHETTSAGNKIAGYVRHTHTHKVLCIIILCDSTIEQRKAIDSSLNELLWCAHGTAVCWAADAWQTFYTATHSCTVVCIICYCRRWLIFLYIYFFSLFISSSR